MQTPSLYLLAGYIAVVLLPLAMLVRVRVRLKGTTLAAAWAWTVAAVVAVGGLELAMLFAAPQEGVLISPLPAWATAARYAAAVLALCPTVALLGAKRPQDRAWQWVVLSFWVIMLVPAVRAYLLLGGDMAVPHPAQGVFLLVVAAMGIVNWIATRFSWAAIAAGTAQVALIAPYTPLSQAFPTIALLNPLPPTLLALVLCYLREHPSRSSDSSERTWLDFRDAYGLFWAARVMARLNAAARAHDWGVEVTWRGITRRDLDRNDAAFERSLRMLLRRFVSDRWHAEPNHRS